jgi:hypothetical protein
MSKIKENWFSDLKDLDYFKTVANPYFLELDGLIVLEAHYNPESIEQLKKILQSRNSPKDLEKAENTINHIHLDDLVEEESLQIELGEYLQKIWMKALSEQFPNYEFECTVKHFETGYELVMWKRRS